MKTSPYCGSAANTAKPILRSAPILLFLLISFLSASAVKRIEANPLCIAVALTEQVDTASLAKTLAFYGYVPQPTHTERSSDTASADTSYLTYAHPNGSQIRYTIAYTEGQFYPTVEVKSNLSQRSKDDTLKKLRFEKNGNHYERRSQTHLSRCTIGSNGIITISCHPKPAKPYYN